MSRPRIGDLELKETVALPNGAATTEGAAIRLGCGTPHDFTADCELKITVPDLATGDLADAATLTISVITDDTDTFDGETVLLQSVIVLTGAGGAGATGTTAQVRLPIGGVKEYIGLKCVKTGAGDASDKSATLEMLF